MSKLVITNARVVDSRGVIAESTDIHVEGDEIVRLRGEAASPGSITLDAAGRTVCPGLMNAHVHLCFDGSPDPEPGYTSETSVQTALKAVARLRETLARGVTTVRDLGGKPEVTFALANAVEDSSIMGPKVIAAGKVITTKKGHGHWMGIEVTSPEEARTAAREMIESGAGVLKLMATAGMMTSGQVAGAPQLTVAEMRACIEEARRGGIPVTAHVESRQGAANAIEAGVDSIEHGHGLDRDLLQRMRDDGIALVPTISCDRAITRSGPDNGVPMFIVEDCARLAPSLEKALRIAVEIGVEIAAGNDGGAPLTHWGDMVDELEVYVEMGMSPRAALQTATTNTADLFGLRSTGLVEPGHRADLLVLRGDPLDSIEHLRSPEMVVAAGRLVESPDPATN